MGPAAALTLLVFGGFALGTTVAGAGLSRGYAWPIAWLKALFVLAAVSVVAVFAFAPLLIYIGAVQIGLAGFVLLAPIRYLERPSVRAVLRPPKKDRVRPAMAPLRRLAPTLRSIGGFGLFVWGIGAAAFFGYLWARAAADPPPGLEGLIVFVAGTAYRSRAGADVRGSAGSAGICVAYSCGDRGRACCRLPRADRPATI
jgi:hypothetical protein